jgi:hypothetical protein
LTSGFSRRFDDRLQGTTWWDDPPLLAQTFGHTSEDNSKTMSIPSQHHTSVTTPPGRRYASRREAMAYMRVGSTKMNELLQAQMIAAKKYGAKVIVDLDSVDAYIAALPNVGSPS